MEHLVGYYYTSIINAFRPYGLELDLKMWGGRLPYSNRKKPSLTMHMVDSLEKVSWLRGFFIWNLVPWEESIIHDAIRNVKEFREKFNITKIPIMKRDPKDIKYLLQDVIINYRSIIITHKVLHIFALVEWAVLWQVNNKVESPDSTF